jgi:hypothetical protein
VEQGKETTDFQEPSNQTRRSFEVRTGLELRHLLMLHNVLQARLNRNSPMRIRVILLFYKNTNYNHKNLTNYPTNKSNLSHDVDIRVCFDDVFHAGDFTFQLADAAFVLFDCLLGFFQLFLQAFLLCCCLL